MALRRVLSVGAAVVAVAAMAALAPAQGSPAAVAPKGTVTVSAAASLKDAFPVIGAAFQKRFPGTVVKFNFGGSAALVEQIRAGAPVDVLATASEPTMAKAVNAGLVGRPRLFAKNTMAIAMPPSNPARITSLADLSRPGVLVAV